MKIALTNLGKYNEGILDFVWLTLPATDDEIAEAFDQIQVSHDGKHYYSNGLGQVADNDIYGEYEEFFISDYECDYMQIGEYDNLSELNRIAEEVENLNEGQQDIIKALMNEGYDLEEALDIMDDCHLYDGCYDMSEVAYDIAYETGLIASIPENLQIYFDFEAFGRDLALEGQFIETDKGMLQVIR